MLITIRENHIQFSILLGESYLNWEYNQLTGGHRDLIRGGKLPHVQF